MKMHTTDFYGQKAAMPICPRCGTEIDTDNAVYTAVDGQIAGCEKCIHIKYGWQFCTYYGEVEENGEID